ncbi:MAG: hypothetical protein LBI42_15835 [Chitinispirillales bacterium]|jgi:hypothetical protein|nr:hypothetical protein [Chitinispirillales bacterium]
MQFIKLKLINIIKFTCVGIFTLLCLCLSGCQGSGSFGYRSDIGWYWCHHWIWEPEPDEPCPPPRPEKYWPDVQKAPPYQIAPGQTGVQYGYDDFYDFSDMENRPEIDSPRKVYISLDNRSSTEINLKLMNMNFSSYTLSAEPSNLISVLTFDADNNQTDILRTSVTNKVVIKSLGGTGTAKIVITGVNAESEKTVISGCDECDVTYIVKVYNEIIIRDYPVYNLSGNSINSSTIRNALNSYISQAVGYFSSPTITNIALENWDKNRNGIIDFCYGPSSVCEEFLVIEDAIISHRRITDYEKLRDSTFVAVLPGAEIRDHYYINRDVPANSQTIQVTRILLDDQFFERGKKIEIGNWLTESNPNFETYTIDNYDYNTNTITIKEFTSRIHRAGETFYSSVAGFTVRNNSYVTQNSSYKTWLHEILHQEYFGGFPHVMNNQPLDYTMNVMYPYAETNQDNKNSLCGRPLMIFRPQNGDTHDSQWDRFHTKSKFR